VVSTFLLRVVIPDRPGMLGAVASALGSVDADIISLDVVERTQGGAVDDLVVELPDGRLPDTLVSAARAVADVRVESIRVYAGALDTQRELELIEAMTDDPSRAVAQLVAGVPRIFRAGWCVVVRRTGADQAVVEVVSKPAPADPGKVLDGFGPMSFDRARILDPDTDLLPDSFVAMETDLMAVPFDGSAHVLVVGRPGGPAFRPSEVARLAHLAGIGLTISDGRCAL
jgi:hypothetical protein